MKDHFYLEWVVLHVRIDNPHLQIASYSNGLQVLMVMTKEICDQYLNLQHLVICKAKVS